MMQRLNNCRAFRRGLGLGALVTGLALASATPILAVVVVDDSWADGGRTNGADPLDSNWWTSSATSGIEVSVGSLGLVTGTASGRGIHTIFPTQTLANPFDKLVATYTFRTPATIAPAVQSAGFKVGLFDTLGRAGLNANITSSSGTPSPLYGYFGATPSPTTALPGYMLDMDVNTPGTEDLNFRQHDTAQTASTPTGRLLGTNTGFTNVSPSGPDGAYSFAANTTYTGSFTITRLNATQMLLTGALGTATHSVTDTFDSASVGMLAFWVNSATFGTSDTPGAADNGIDFSNVKIEYIQNVPEAGAFLLGALATTLTGAHVLLRRCARRDD